jgi:hypothetical protein
MEFRQRFSLNKSMPCQRHNVIPSGKVGIHFEIEKAMFGFPLEFIPCFMRDGNDKLRRYQNFRCAVSVYDNSSKEL